MGGHNNAVNQDKKITNIIHRKIKTNHNFIGFHQTLLFNPKGKHLTTDSHNNPRHQQRNTQQYTPRSVDPNGSDSCVSHTAIVNSPTGSFNNKYAARGSHIYVTQQQVTQKQK